MKTNENGLKTLSFNDNDKIKGKVNSTRIDFLGYAIHTSHFTSHTPFDNLCPLIFFNSSDPTTEN
ncbi:hypothetical protein DVH24_016031 [Malus domestica]|uniref:Uncharacterized protein n=1 Tax=Malus domestica TaxID=3750 RepID=A0A498JJ45_MALDO|nr:hypothetical protein DVH24_016031 [Malus domestica]